MRWSRRDPAAGSSDNAVPPPDVEFLDFGPERGEPDTPDAGAFEVRALPPQPVPDHPRWPAPPTRGPAAEAVSPTALTCIRLNCTEQGRPTTAPRCLHCGHATQLLSNYRWPRPVS